MPDLTDWRNTPPIVGVDVDEPGMVLVENAADLDQLDDDPDDDPDERKDGE